MLETHAPPEDDGTVPFVHAILGRIGNLESMEPWGRESELMLGWRRRIRRNAGAR